MSSITELTGNAVSGGRPKTLGDKNMRTEHQLKEKFDRSTDEQLWQHIKAHGPAHPNGAYCLMLLQKRSQEANSDALRSIDERLSTVEVVASTPEHRTWTFLLILFTFIATLIGVAIAFYGLNSPASLHNHSGEGSPIHSEPSQELEGGESTQ